MTPIKKGRKRYAGDLTEADFISPRGRKNSVLIFKSTIRVAKRRVKTLRQTVSRARKKIKDLQSLLKHLQDKKLIVPDVVTIIQVKLDDLFAGLILWK